MSRPTPTATTTNRFFLRFHRYITTPPHPHHALTKPPHQHPPIPNRTISSSAPGSYYDLFPATLPHGPPPRGPFTLNPRLLRREYLQLQAQHHPDRHPGSKLRAEGTSARINEAYRTLQSPLLRAQHVLQQRGVDVGGDEGARVEDVGLLTEVMEAREAIEAVGGEGEVEAMKARNEARIAESEGLLGEAFGRDDLEAARAEAVRLRYWVNIKESLDAWEKGKPVVLVH